MIGRFLWNCTRRFFKSPKENDCCLKTACLENTSWFSKKCAKFKSCRGYLG